MARILCPCAISTVVCGALLVRVYCSDGVLSVQASLTDAACADKPPQVRPLLNRPGVNVRGQL